MKKTFRFYIALWGAKAGTVLLKLLRRNATYFPGKFALTICPDFMGRIEKPKTIIGVTGTNGKTTVCNMINDVLEKNEIKVLNNRLGSNINSGIATSLITGANLSGKSKHDLAVFESDERSALLIYKYVHPDYIVCTNLFRDSSKRNAHTEFIVDILNKGIPVKSKMILNADDLISSNIAPNNERIYFGIDKLETDTKESKNIVKDIVVCPKCDTKLQYEYYRYHHIGRAHCPNCDFGTQEAKYLVKNIDLNNMQMEISIEGKIEKYSLISDNIINIYNQLAAIALLKELGISYTKINNTIKDLKIVETRFMQKRINQKELIMHLAKGQNPIACSRAVDFISKQEGKKSVLLALDDMSDNNKSAECDTWFYETDFELLKEESITQIIAAGPRCYDMQVRLLIAGVPKEKIICVENELDAPEKIDYLHIDKICVLYDLYLLDTINKVRELIEKQMIK